MLEQLLVSIARFWPKERWKSTVWVVLDAESPADQALCAQLNRGTLATCVLEDAPAFLATMPLYGKGWSRGVARSMWSQHFADKYSAADFVALMDADAVFFTPHIAELLFDRAVAGLPPRPVMFASWGPLFALNPIALGLPWVAEFMDTFPFVVQ